MQQHGTSVIDSTEAWAVELKQRIGESKATKFEVCYNIEDDGNPWFFDIQNYIQDRAFPEYATSQDKEAVRRIATRYFMRTKVLFKRSFSRIELRCITYEEVEVILKEMHEGICGGHINPQFMAKMILQRGYYWPIMELDCADKVRRCKQCQIHADRIHALASNPTQAVWPFSM